MHLQVTFVAEECQDHKPYITVLKHTNGLIV